LAQNVASVAIVVAADAAVDAAAVGFVATVGGPWYRIDDDVYDK
jgi:hypothetical protein